MSKEECKYFRLKHNKTVVTTMISNENGSISNNFIKGLMAGITILSRNLDDQTFALEIFDSFDKIIPLDVHFVTDTLFNNVTYGNVPEKYIIKEAYYWFFADISNESNNFLLCRFRSSEVIRGIITVFEIFKLDIMLLSPTLPFMIVDDENIYFEFQNDSRKYTNRYENKYIENIPFMRDNIKFC